MVLTTVKRLYVLKNKEKVPMIFERALRGSHCFSWASLGAFLALLSARCWAKSWLPSHCGRSTPHTCSLVCSPLLGLTFATWLNILVNSRKRTLHIKLCVFVLRNKIPFFFTSSFTSSKLHTRVGNGFKTCNGGSFPETLMPWKHISLPRKCLDFLPVLSEFCAWE